MFSQNFDFSFISSIAWDLDLEPIFEVRPKAQVRWGLHPKRTDLIWLSLGSGLQQQSTWYCDMSVWVRCLCESVVRTNIISPPAGITMLQVSTTSMSPLWATLHGQVAICQKTIEHWEFTGVWAKWVGYRCIELLRQATSNRHSNQPTGEVATVTPCGNSYNN